MEVSTKGAFAGLAALAVFHYMTQHRLKDVRSKRIRIGTRTSNLAMWQALHVEALLKERYPETKVEVVGVNTLGLLFFVNRRRTLTRYTLLRS